VLGVRIWTEGDKASLPAQSRSSAPTVAQLYQVLGFAAVVYGLVVLNPLVTVLDVLIVQGGKLWFIDRMVLLCDGLACSVGRQDRLGPPVSAGAACT
jgi:hypothetical protein